MRLTTRLGLGLLLVGAVAILVSSGAFDSMEADRGTELNAKEDDSEALLNITYPQGQQFELDASFDRDGPFLFNCDALSWPCYRYEDIEIVRFSDNTPGGQLQINNIDITPTSDANFAVSSTSRNSLSSPELEAVSASFECDAYWAGGIIGGEWRQNQGSGSVTVEVQASDGDLTIDATRTVEVDCG